MATEKNITVETTTKKFEKGTYKALCTLPIYDKIGKDKKQKRNGELSAACRTNKGRSYGYALAAYQKDEQFSVTEVIVGTGETFGKTPSGYICIADSKKEYCTQV